jgi:hypothetical protein
VAESFWQWQARNIPDQERAAQQRALESLKLPDAYTPGTQGFNPRTNPSAYIRALIEETDKMPVDLQAEARARTNLGFPEIRTRPKDRARIEMDARRRHYLEKMLAAYGVPSEPGVEPEAWQVLSEEPRKAMMNYATNAGSVAEDAGFRDEIGSMRESVGILGPGSPLHTAGTWMQSLPRAVYATAELGWGEGKNKNAMQNLHNAWNTFTAPVQAIAGVDGGTSAWKDADIAKETVQDQDWKTAAYGAKYAEDPADTNWNPYQRAAGESFLLSQIGDPQKGTGSADDGMQFFMRGGVPRRPARWAGMLTDAFLNPVPPSVGPFLSAVKAGRLGAAAVHAGVELGPDLLVAGAGELNDYQANQQADELIKRLSNQ